MSHRFGLKHLVEIKSFSAWQVTGLSLGATWCASYARYRCIHILNNHIMSCLVRSYMGVSKNRGTPPWMVYNGKPIKMDDLGVPLFSETSIC